MTQPYTQAAVLVAGLRSIERDFHSVCEASPSVYSKKSCHGASIGGHMRHILEFVQILATCAKGDCINYEERQRNTLFETDPQAAASAFSDYIDNLATLLHSQGHTHPLSITEMPGFGLPQISVPSSLGREVLYSIEHAIHHFALIKIIATEMGFELNAGFGVAPATMAHAQAQGCQEQKTTKQDASKKVA